MLTRTALGSYGRAFRGSIQGSLEIKVTRIEVTHYKLRCGPYIIKARTPGAFYVDLNFHVRTSIVPYQLKARTHLVVSGP